MLKIVNEASYPFAYELFTYATSSPLASGFLYPNQIDAYQYDAVPGDGQSAIYCLMTTYTWNPSTRKRGEVIESEVRLPANATVTIATQIQTGYLRPSS